MNHKQFIAELASKMNTNVGDISKINETFVNVITEYLKNLDSIAIPSFGKFEALKQDEKISIDLSTGKRILLPPVINISFTPASALIKSFENIK